MSDTLVLDMSTQSEGAAAVFTKKDWLSILDNQNQNYQGNQSVIDTSQLANSNKYMNYREGYFTVPLMLTVTGVGVATPWTPAAPADNSNFIFGMKNWYGSIVHSFTLDYNGTTIIQQTPFIGLWNTFKLMTSLSMADVKTQGSLIGFYPDDSQTYVYLGSKAAAVGLGNNTNFRGIGICNNRITPKAQTLFGIASSTEQYSSDSPASCGVNNGLFQRMTPWNQAQGTIVGSCLPTGGALSNVTNAQFISASNMNLLWQSYVFNTVSGVAGPPITPGVWQASICAVIYLKHLHAFFERVPLLKGVFMKMTLNLNQSSVSWSMVAGAGAPAAGIYDPLTSNVIVSSPLGGVSPLMIAGDEGSFAAAERALVQGSYIYSLSVGPRCLNTTQTNLGGALVQTNPVGVSSIILNVPAYTFNPVFEQSYLASPVKKIVYTDVYQYQIVNQIGAGKTFNNLITNGIANIKSVLVLPYMSSGSATAAGATVDLITAAAGNFGLSPIQSPFDPAGGGPTSPLVNFTQFNIQISGQNAIYNTERYNYEQFANQFKGVNAINGGQTDGLVSGLVGFNDWQKSYSYYYVNCGRMLPMEESVPKSVNLLGTNTSQFPIDLYIFVEYGVEVSIDVLTGARV